MNALTHDFDIALQVRADVIEQIIQAQHRAGLLRHFYVRAQGDRQIEVQVHRPSVSLVTGQSPDSLARIVLRSRIFYHSRARASLDAPGSSAVADATLRATLSISTGDPAPLGPGVMLIVDPHETDRNDIVVHGATPALESEVKDALIDLIFEAGGGRYAIPRLGSGTARIGSVAFRFLPGGQSVGPLIIVGMNEGNVVKGDKAGLTQIFVQNDWAMALSSEYVLAKLRDALRAEFGNRLPPPHGPAPVLVSSREVCTLELPLVGCVDRSTQRVFVTELDVTLTPGAIRVEGRLRVTTSAFYVPTVNASFEADVTLSVTSDQQIYISVGQIRSDVEGFLADIANFVSGGALERFVRDGVRRALLSGIQQDTLTGIFSSETLSELATVGVTDAVQASTHASSIEVRSDAVVIHGGVVVSDRSTSPRAQFAVIRPADSLTRRVFHAGKSWSPGGETTEYKWDFGDGTTQTTVGVNARFVTERDFAPGVYPVCLTVRDDAGRSTMLCRNVATATLELRHDPITYQGVKLTAWYYCQAEGPIDVELLVVDNETAAPVADASVLVQGQGSYEVKAVTDANGKAAFQVEITGGRVRVDTRGRGFMTVQATKNGYVASALERLYFVDCTQLLEPIDLRDLKRLLDDLYRLHEEVVELVAGLGGPLPDPPLRQPDLGPYSNQLRDLGLTLDILTRTLLLLERGADPGLMSAFMGIDSERSMPGIVAAQRLEATFSAVSKSLDAVRADAERQKVLKSGPSEGRGHAPR